MPSGSDLGGSGRGQDDGLPPQPVGVALTGSNPPVVASVAQSERPARRRQHPGLL
jgi:hypothetical protein